MFGYTELKYSSNINFICFFFTFFNVANRKFKIAYVVCIMFLLVGAGLHRVCVLGWGKACRGLVKFLTGRCHKFKYFKKNISSYWISHL